MRSAMSDECSATSRWITVAFVYLVCCATFARGSPDDGGIERTFDVNFSEREWFRILHVDNLYVLIGASNAVYNVSLVDMAWTNLSFELDQDGRRACTMQLGHYFQSTISGDKCINYVRTALKESDTHFIFCGSNGGAAKCRDFIYNAASGKWAMSNSSSALKNNAPPFAPPFPWMNFTLIKTSEDLLFTGGSLLDFTRRMMHAVFRNGSRDDSIKSMLTNRWTETTVHSLRTYVSDEPLDARIYPNFVSSFEMDEYVYWVFSENALESQPFQFVSTSRIARVCKNDASHRNELINDYYWGVSSFVTFWKATLECSVPGQYSDFGSYAYDRLGYNTFYFNTVAATSELKYGSVHPRSDEQPAEQIMYSVFNTDRNSIRGSAICAYNYASIETPFHGPLYLLEATDMLMASSRENTWTWKLLDFENPVNSHKIHPATCVNDTRQLDDFYEKQAMLAHKVKPISGRPLFVQTDHSYQMTHLVVDWQLRALDGHYYDVLFVGTDHGDLLKIVNVGLNGVLNFTIVENRSSLASGQAFGELRLIATTSDDSSSGHSRVLLVNTFDSVKKVALEKCASYSSCAKCVELRDPYCSWSAAEAKCVAIYDGSQPDEHYQNIQQGKDARCMPPPSAETTAPLEATDARTTEATLQSTAAPESSGLSTPARTKDLPQIYAEVTAKSAPGGQFAADASDERDVAPPPVSDKSLDASSLAGGGNSNLILVSAITGVVCMCIAFPLGCIAGRKFHAKAFHVPYLEQQRRDDDLASSKLEDPYTAFPVKSNNLTPNRLNNTVATSNEILSANVYKGKMEYV